MSLDIEGRKYYDVLSRELGHDLTSKSFAQALDARDPLKQYRSQFCIPKRKDVVAPAPPSGEDVIEKGNAGGGVMADGDEKALKNLENPDGEAIYFCGNSLGLLPKSTRAMIDQELDVWASVGVQGHFKHKFGRPWVTIDDHVVPPCAKIVGAKPVEISIMNSLTANLHFLMTSFYRPTGKKVEILIEGRAFPSDHYAVESQIRLHGNDPAKSLILLNPREGECTLRTEDIIRVIGERKETLALVMLSGVQYYTGQAFNIQAITEAAHEHGVTIGWDLAHAVGNIPLRLHDWGVDFACWCTYKYLNAGAGGIGGAFIHEKHHQADLPRLLGWWGTDPEHKFEMDNIFRPIPGPQGYRLSNPSILTTTALLASLQIFSKTSMEDLRAKSVLLTGYLDILLADLSESITKATGQSPFRVLTPAQPADRGCQLSIQFFGGVLDRVLENLECNAVVVDERKPDVVRVAPAPLYNQFTEVWEFVRILGDCLQA
ncbi:pyridoxal phosphate-dependent transferase [Phlyctochytrium arcticum]|nr:pyridoxal phosphate-dependent transferase [Phlyctochytrium arcticum]